MFAPGTFIETKLYESGMVKIFTAGLSPTTMDILVLELNFILSIKR